MGLLSKKHKNRFIAIISKLDEKIPLKNEIVYCSENNSLVSAKEFLLSYIDYRIPNRPYFESDGKVREGKDAYKAMSEALIPSNTVITKKELDQYYDNFTSVQFSFWTMDEHMYRTVYGVRIVRSNDE